LIRQKYFAPAQLLRGVFFALMLLASANLIAQLNSLVTLPDSRNAVINNESKSHRIEKWELLEEDFVFGVTVNEKNADHLKDYDSSVVGRGWIPVKYTSAINDLYCPHPSPKACSENCGIRQLHRHQ